MKNHILGFLAVMLLFNFTGCVGNESLNDNRNQESEPIHGDPNLHGDLNLHNDLNSNRKVDAKIRKHISVIIIDPGHGGIDSGAIGNHIINGKNYIFVKNALRLL